MTLVRYVNHMGDDETICDAARVSFDKKSDMFSVSQNEKLIGYLAKHNHWSPFSHGIVQLHFTAPIFIARQLQKHQVGFAWNEVSRRYVSNQPTVWRPDYLRPKAENVKQGSKDEKHVLNDILMQDYDGVVSEAISLYNHMIDCGVCPEQARAVLPQGAMTEWMWTGSVYAWARMYKLRSEATAQKEVQDYANAVSPILSKYFPISWRELTSG